jgi:putative DNA primase/helicase
MSSVRLDFEGLANRLLTGVRELLPNWFPNGKFVGAEFHIGSLAGEAGSSLKVNIRSGKWQDFATGEHGTDLISLYAKSKHIEMGAAYNELGGAEPYKPLPATPPKAIPPSEQPAEQPEFEYAKYSDFNGKEFIHHKFGTAKFVKEYPVKIENEWKIACVMARFEYDEGKKSFLPYIWTRHGWKAKMPPEPRPIYGHKRLEEFPTKPVMVVEGEKCADAIEKLFQNTPAVCWMGGAANVLANDWTPLKGRHVILWPDADKPGWDCMKKLGSHLLKLGVSKLQWIDNSDSRDGEDVADIIPAVGGTTGGVNAWVAKRISDFTEDVNSGPSNVVQLPVKTTKPRENDGVFHVETADARWARWGLQRSSRMPFANEANVKRCLESMHNEKIISLPWYDRFKNRLLWRREENGPIEQWTEVETQDVLVMLQGVIGIQNMRMNIVERSIYQWAHQHSRDCWQEFLYSLRWDGVSRLESLFTKGMGAEESDYTKAVGRCFMIGMVARGLSPGCQLDYVVVLEGPQGNLKSSACRALGEPYFAEVHTEIGTVRWQEVIQGLALAEFAEMQSWSSSKNEAIKAAITCRTDKYRAAYARDSAEHPRRVAFIATTNGNKWGMDETGLRRFWPIKTTVIDLPWIKQNRNQMLAEAVARYQKGEKYHMNTTEEAQAKTEQRARQGGDPWDMAIDRYLSSRSSATVSDVALFALDMPVGKIGWQEARRIAGVLRKFGWIEGDGGTFTPGDELKDYREDHPRAAQVK